MVSQISNQKGCASHEKLQVENQVLIPERCVRGGLWRGKRGSSSEFSCKLISNTGRNSEGVGAIGQKKRRRMVPSYLIARIPLHNINMA